MLSCSYPSGFPGKLGRKSECSPPYLVEIFIGLPGGFEGNLGGKSPVIQQRNRRDLSGNASKEGILTLVKSTLKDNPSGTQTLTPSRGVREKRGMPPIGCPVFLSTSYSQPLSGHSRRDGFLNSPAVDNNLEVIHFTAPKPG